MTTSPSDPSDDDIFDMAELFALVSSKNRAWLPLHTFFNRLARSLESAGWKKGQPMSQNAKLLKLMKDGRSVTRLTAMHYGIMNLTARISELRGAGHNVVCTMKTDLNGAEYGEFTLAR